MNKLKQLILRIKQWLLLVPVSVEQVTLHEMQSPIEIVMMDANDTYVIQALESFSNVRDIEDYYNKVHTFFAHSRSPVRVKDISSPFPLLLNKKHIHKIIVRPPTILRTYTEEVKHYEVD